jgi:two-component system, NtrC family, nitrogen regulation response regulator NtrX
MILIVDDNPDFCSTMEDIVQSLDYDTFTLQKPSEAIDFVNKHAKRISTMLLDIEFGPSEVMNGLDVLSQIKKSNPALPVIMISGKGTIDTAVKATKLGAMNFIEKSIVSKQKIKEVLESAIDKYEVKGEAKEIQKFLEVHGIIGKSKIILDIGDNIIRFGRTDLNVLLSGETGTGKKLVAKAIHAVSRRAKSPFVTVDIPNIPRELFQSELFGHNKGSFSGATDSKKGLFHQSNKGTLFLDEIGDLSLELQSNLFIPIEEKQIRRVGSIEAEELDVRFISATDKDLVFAMKEAKFREQLYHRLRECEIFIPPLRERAEDIPLITAYYLKLHNMEFDDNKRFSPIAIEYLQEQHWQGNVRELASVIKVTLQTTSTEQVEVADIQKVSRNNIKHDPELSASEMRISSDRTLKEDLAQMDKKKIEATLESNLGNVTKSASSLGVSRETLHNKIRKYGINVQIYRAKRNK